MRKLTIVAVMIFGFAMQSCIESKTTEATSFDHNEALELSVDEQNFAFTLENINAIADNFEQDKIVFPRGFANANFLEDSYVIGDEIDVLIGNIVQKVRVEGANSYFLNLAKNYKKSDVNLKLKTSQNPIIFEERFDYNTSSQLNVFFGNISSNQDVAYLFHIIELSNVYVNDNDIDLERLRESVKALSNIEKEDLFIIMGVTNFYLEATGYEKSNLRGEFDYAISISGNKYTKTSKMSREKKIAVAVVPLSKFLRLN